jgi:hypothetical protein
MVVRNMEQVTAQFELFELKIENSKKGVGD